MILDFWKIIYARKYLLEDFMPKTIQEFLDVLRVKRIYNILGFLVGVGGPNCLSYSYMQK